jgi:hypothetical protein
MKLSREKILRLSHLILDYIEDDEAIDYFVDPQQLRGEVMRIIESEMRTDEAIDALVRRKLESQKRTIIEAPTSGKCCTASTTKRSSRSTAR